MPLEAPLRFFFVIPGRPKAPATSSAAAWKSSSGQRAASCTRTDPAGHGPSYQLQGIGHKHHEPLYEAVQVSWEKRS